VLAAFNLSGETVSFDWPALDGAAQMQVDGLQGSAERGRVTLPAYGAWFGTLPADR
jgi:alpha-glucosidase